MFPTIPPEIGGLLRQRLEDSLVPLFWDLTGLRLHVVWAAPSLVACDLLRELCPGKAREIGAGSASPRWLESAIARPRSAVAETPWKTVPESPGRKPHAADVFRCDACLRVHWKSCLEAGEPRHPFTGDCGALNLCAPLEVRSVRLASLVLHCRRATQPADLACFRRAVALLGLAMHDLEQTAALHCARESRGPAGIDSSLARNLAATQDPEQTGADFPTTSAFPPLASPQPWLVGAMVKYVERYYSCPLTLKGLALELHRNASYLSDLFARSTGMPFHAFLNQTRLRQAEALLATPAAPIRAVARAVGFADEHAFRWAFKRSHGLPPSAWRSIRLRSRPALAVVHAAGDPEAWG